MASESSSLLSKTPADSKRFYFLNSTTEQRARKDGDDESAIEIIENTPSRLRTSSSVPPTGNYDN